MSAQPAALEHVFDFDHILAYIIAGMLIAIFVLLFYNRLYVFKEQDQQKKGQIQNSRLSLVLQTGNLVLWQYFPQTRHYIVLSQEGHYSAEYNPVEFSQFYDRSDFDRLQSAIFDMCDGKINTSEVRLKGMPSNDGSQHLYDIKVSVSERDSHGNIKRILGVQRDVTADWQKKENVSQLLMRFHTVFNSSLADMIYYDNKGILRDINETACQSFNVPNREFVMNGEFLLQNNPMFEKIELEELQNTRTTAIIDWVDYTADRYHLDDFKLGGKMYYESTINPIRDVDGKLTGVYMAGRNITEMVESFHRQRESAIQLKKATESIKEYIDNINYALRISNVRLVNYNPATYSLDISNNVNESQIHLSQLRCIRLGAPRFRRSISSVLNRMDHRTKLPIELTIETEFHDNQQRPVWLMFNMVPILDKEGEVERYFGMCRDITEMVETEQRLAVEKKKAEETDLLKQSFLTNMSYEIRTPLNTVVGFAELFETEHDPADEPIFVEEIKRNSNSLLQLVNDILYLSRLDANMIELKRQDTDFPMLFDSYCQIGWSNINPNVKTIIENPCEHLVVDIDQENLGKVIQIVCQSAARVVEKGFVRAKYEYRHGELAISIEDTGPGLDKESLPHAFDRFARDTNGEPCGTGLDLPIVQALVQLMGGTIEMQSELGKGSVSWISIPCEAKSIVMRREFID
jgi:signal transduction histidine kinase